MNVDQVAIKVETRSTRAWVLGPLSVVSRIVPFPRSWQAPIERWVLRGLWVRCEGGPWERMSASMAAESAAL